MSTPTTCRCCKRSIPPLSADMVTAQADKADPAPAAAPVNGLEKRQCMGKCSIELGAVTQHNILVSVLLFSLVFR